VISSLWSALLNYSLCKRFLVPFLYTLEKRARETSYHHCKAVRTYLLEHMEHIEWSRPNGYKQLCLLSLVICQSNEYNHPFESLLYKSCYTILFLSESSFISFGKQGTKTRHVWWHKSDKNNRSYNIIKIKLTESMQVASPSLSLFRFSIGIRLYASTIFQDTFDTIHETISRECLQGRSNVDPII
jgi:hypothetical protein